MIRILYDADDHASSAAYAEHALPIALKKNHGIEVRIDVLTELDTNEFFNKVRNGYDFVIIHYGGVHDAIRRGEQAKKIN